jgi:hypothetical protein
MSGNRAKIKIIKDTVRNSIMTEVESKLISRGLDVQKQAEITNLIGTKLDQILECMVETELLPQTEPRSADEFSSHIYTIEDITKQKLLDQIGPIE